MNDHVAALLDETAELLDLQGANPFRVNAYRRAAGTVLDLPRDIREVAETFHDPMAGELHVGLIPTVAPYVLPIIMPAIIPVPRISGSRPLPISRATAC